MRTKKPYYYLHIEIRRDPWIEDPRSLGEVQNDAFQGKSTKYDVQKIGWVKSVFKNKKGLERQLSRIVEDIEKVIEKAEKQIQDNTTKGGK